LIVPYRAPCRLEGPNLKLGRPSVGGVWFGQQTGYNFLGVCDEQNERESDIFK
jgi:hypothetical protein